VGRDLRGFLYGVAFALSVVATVGALFVLPMWREKAGAADALAVSLAKVATGPCGDARIVSIDNERVAVAGGVIHPKYLQYYSFREDRNGLKVFYRDPQSKRPQLVMVRRHR